MYRTEEPLASRNQKSQPQVALEITRGQARHKRRPVRGGAFLIGTAPDNDLVLGDPRFDELHSYVLVRDGRVTVRHLGTGPALSIAGEPVTWASLESGDRLAVGPFEFEIRIDGGEQGANVPSGVESRAISNDAALERLLRDVERGRPRLAVYAGDCQAPRPAARPKMVSRKTPPLHRLRRAGL